jgi:DNA-binding MarR family transcriptional regulator
VQKRKKGARFTLRTDAAKVIKEDLGWHCRNAARAIGRVFDRHLAPAGLTSIQFSLLCLIASAPRDTMGELAQAAGLDQSTLTRNIETLAKAGWVEIVTAEADRRKRAVWLTETGAFLLQQAMPSWHAAQAEFSQRLNGDLAPLLMGITGHLS